MDRHDVIEVLIVVVVIILGLGVTFGIMVGANYAIERPTCNKTIDRLGLEGDWGLWTGCVVEVDGRSIPLDQFFVNEEANE